MTVSIEEFTRWLKLGLGRAVLHLQKHEATPYREVILEACLHNWAYDGQVEGNRATYMFDVISLTGEIDFYREQIFKALADKRNGLDGQVDDLVLCFAKQGNTEARQLLYDHFVRNSAETHLDAEILIRLDGLMGFTFVVHQIGGQTRTDDDIWEDHHVLNELETHLGKENYQAAIAQLSNEDPLVKAYVTAVETDDARRYEKRKQPDLAQVSYADFRKALLEKRTLGRYPVEWGKLASEADLRLAAEDLLIETERNRLSTYLRIFWKRPFPLAPDYLIELTQHPDRWISVRALGLLSRITHPSVRALAFRLLESPELKWKGRVVDLLVQNHQDGDYVIVERLAGFLADDGEIHSLGMDVSDFYEAHPNPESEIKVLTLLYEKGPCAVCRWRLLKRLIELKALPDWMAEECVWDTEEDIRKLMKEYFEQAQVAN